MVKILFKHWKTGTVLEVMGSIRHDNPQSDRIVIEQPDGTFEDIIKETIISIEQQ
jgi:predicted acetyltransferase